VVSAKETKAFGRIPGTMCPNPASQMRLNRLLIEKYKRTCSQTREIEQCAIDGMLTTEL